MQVEHVARCDALKRMIRFTRATALLGLIALSGCGEETTKETITAAATTAAFRGTVQGFVRDHATNAPISGVTVTLFAGGSRTATTDALGYWFFNDVIPDDDAGATGGNACNTRGCINYHLRAPAPATAGAPNYLDMIGQVALDENTAAAPLISVADYMVKTATVSGVVTNAATGAGINGATVVLNTSDNFRKITPVGSNAAVMLPAQFTATTANHATSGAAGAYSLQVPALQLGANQLGAFAPGFEYSAGVDGSALNLQFSTTAAADFSLNPVDNNLGLVAAIASPVSGVSVPIQIMRDASGAIPPNVQNVPFVDFQGATQLVFTLTFDQPVTASQFFADTIRLVESPAGTVVAPSMTATWTNAYTVTLTATPELNRLTLGTTYRLRTNRNIQTGANTSIPVATDLAQFAAINSALTATVPTPELYLIPGLHDTALQAENGVIRYLAANPGAVTQNAQVTNASNYTGISETAALAADPKSAYALDTNLYTNQLDLRVPRTQANLNASALTLYYRVVNPASGEVLQNWRTPAGTPVPTVNTDYLAYVNVNVATSFPQDRAGLVGGTVLRFGNRLDFAVTVKDTAGIETPIDQTKILSLSDRRAPELTAGSLVSRVYNSSTLGATLVFSEQMNTGAAATVTNVTNGGLFTTAPVWDVGGTSLYVKASSSAAAAVYAPGAAAGLHTYAAPTITFATAGAANGFYNGQSLLITFSDGRVDRATVTAINHAGANPTMNITAITAGAFSTTVPFQITVDGSLNVLRQPAILTGQALADGATTVTWAGQSLAVGDRLLLRSTAGANLLSQLIVTVLSYNSTTGTVTFSPAVVAAAGTYNTVIFEGDVLRVTATDEAGNAMHGDADEIVKDVGGVFGAGVNAIRIR